MNIECADQAPGLVDHGQCGDAVTLHQQNGLRGEFARAVEDCEAVLRLNPYHFGAAAGMGQSLLKMNRPRAALRAFRRALDLNPNLDLHETVRALEEFEG